MDGTLHHPLSSVMDRVRALAPVVRGHQAQSEQRRYLHPEVTQAMVDADLFRLWTPKSLGGAELRPRDLLEVVEAAAAIDGSFGWCLANANTMGRMVAYLGPDVARDWVAGPDCQMAGSTARLGTARRVSGGFRVTGRWPFTSGLPSARRVIGLCKVEGEGTPEAPVLIFCHFPATGITTFDTWRASGLKATGSHDFAVEDIFVPSAQTHGFVDGAAHHDTPLYRFPIVSMLTLSVSCVPLGIAKAAVQAVIDISDRTVAGTNLPLRSRELVQTDVARAEALRRASRALILSALEDLEAALAAGGPQLVEARAFFRVALAHAAESCLKAVELMASAAGTAAILENNPLERCVRDMQAAVKHVAMSPHNFTIGGQVMLGLDMAGTRF